MTLPPLAERMRPQHLSDYIGQAHLIGSEGVLTKTLAQQQLPSLIFWGPPGVGKTTLALLLAKALDRPFYSLSAIAAGVKEVREVLDKAQQKNLFSQPRPILFIDEIHRFNKAQQDALLGAVERGLITLIGATTENPSFEVIGALRSRCQIYILHALTPAELRMLLQQALTRDAYLQTLDISLAEDTALLHFSGGDARKLLNNLEIVIHAQDTSQPIVITDTMVSHALQQPVSGYDKNGEQHYDIVSAFIKSIRGSDPNAAVYWLARMISGGEDPIFICRRMVIAAAEDIGLANPNALLLATACLEATQMVGLPEARIIMAEAAIYLATSAKSNTAYKAINAALAAVTQYGNLPVPLALRNAPTNLMRDLEYGKNYQYAHDFAGNFVAAEFMPPELSRSHFYEPAQNTAEERLRQQLRQQWHDKYGY